MRFKDGKLVSPVTIRAGFAMRNQIETYIAGREVVDSKGQKVKRFYFNNKGILLYEKEKTVINPRTVLSGIASTKNGTNAIINLLDSKLFDFPKPIELICYLTRLVTNRSSQSIILDFFSGSATTAHAVMQLNSEDGGNRQFIMVQLPEKCAEQSEAYKAGYKTICDIGEERIRRAGRKIRAEWQEKNGLFAEGAKQNEESDSQLDVGFRVFRVDSSNIKSAYLTPSQYEKPTLTNLTDFSESIKPDRTPEDLVIQSMLALGVPLSETIREEEIEGKHVFFVGDTYLVACFDKNVSESVVEAIAKRHPSYAVFLDSGIDSDATLANFDQIFEQISPTTERRII